MIQLCYLIDMTQMSAGEILERIPADFGMSFQTLKESIKKNGNEMLISPDSSYAITFITNINFRQGPRNGGGAGYYAYLNDINDITSIWLCAE
jgi:hypothetical protein